MSSVGHNHRLEMPRQQREAERGRSGGLILATEQVNICPPFDKRLAVGAVVGVEGGREVGVGCSSDRLQMHRHAGKQWEG